MNEGTQALVRKLKAGLVKLYGARLRGLYLFGSHARGDEDAESDVDVLIVLDRIMHYGAEVDRTGALVSELSLQAGVSISRVFVSEDAWRGGESAFLRNVRAEGIAA